MRTVIGWMAAMLASALLGAAVYQTVLSKPLPELDPTATVEKISRDPNPGPTIYRTEVRTVVEPTPTVTVDDVVLIEQQAIPATQTRPSTSTPAPARTSAPRPQASDERDEESDDEDREDEPDDDEDSEDREDEPDDDEDSEED